MAAKIGSRERKRKHAALVRRDGPNCWYCGAPNAETLDHVKPKSAGGSNALTNLRLACEDCNQDKGGFHGPGAYSRLVGKPSQRGHRTLNAPLVTVPRPSPVTSVDLPDWLASVRQKRLMRSSPALVASSGDQHTLGSDSGSSMDGSA